MADRFLQACRAIELSPENGAAELAELRKKLPSRQARRMSPLGILLTEVLSGFPLNRDTVLFYVTTFTESLALEAYLGSFPHPSPTHFQTSIHPGGIEQALILKQQPITALYPMAGGKAILSQAFHLACQEGRPEVLVVAGEEAGTWLADMGAASRQSFAWALHFNRQPENTLATLSFRPAAEANPPADGSPSLHDFARQLESRTDLAWNGPSGHFSWQWK